MSNYPNLAAEAGDKYLAMLAQSQDQILEFVRSSKEMMPKLPEGFGAQAPAMPYAMPFSVPSAQDVADAQYRFATEFLKQQESFARKLYQSPAGKSSASKSSAKSASRASAAPKRAASTGRATRSRKASS